MKRIALSLALLALAGLSIITLTTLRRSEEASPPTQESPLAPGPTTKATKGQVEVLQKQLLLLRSLNQKLVKAPRSRLRQVAVERLKDLEKAPPQKGALVQDFFRYYRMRLQIVAGQRREGRKAIVELAGSATMAPEALQAFFDIASEKEGYHRERTLGRLLPLSTFAKSVKPTQRYGDARQPPIPVTDQRVLIEVAEIFFHLKLFDEATVAYQEAAYSFPPEFTMAFNTVEKESWLSVVTAPLWLNAAECEWQLGHPHRAADYMAKAVVFGSEPVKNAALKRLAEWKQNPSPTPAHTPALEELDSDDLKQIAKFYAGMNMHPRAIRIMTGYEAALGMEAGPLRAKYEKEWLDLLRRYCFATVEGKCFVFGQNVSLMGDRLRVVIPPPCGKEALQGAANVMKSFMKTPAEPVKTPARPPF